MVTSPSLTPQGWHLLDICWMSPHTSSVWPLVGCAKSTIVRYISTFVRYISRRLMANLGKLGYGGSQKTLWCHDWHSKSLADSIPHPYWMYIKCLSTFICCGWAYGFIVTLLYLSRVGAKFWKIWVRCIPNDVVVSHGWGSKPLLTASQIHIGCL